MAQVPFERIPYFRAPMGGKLPQFSGRARREDDLVAQYGQSLAKLRSDGKGGHAEPLARPAILRAKLSVDYQDADLHPNRLVRLLHTSWPAFRAFRVDVRVSWTVVIWPVVFGAGFLRGGYGAADAATWGLAWTLGLFATVWFHEMGHIAMGRRCGVETHKMTLRGLGGLAHLDAPAQTPQDEMKIALAGPATHLLWMAVLFPALWLLGDRQTYPTWFAMLHGFAHYQLFMMIFNLLPVWPLDGGRTLRGAFATRMNANRASYLVSNIGFVGNGALIALWVVSLVTSNQPIFDALGFVSAWIGWSGVQACRRLRLEALYGDAYGDSDPFQKTLLESQTAVREMEEEEKSARRSVRDARARAQETADRILDRINELGGVEKLSARERKELEEASRALAKGE